jgi:hypothetical protein
MSFTVRREQPAVTRLTELVQELLDAHCDTVCLCERIDKDDADWSAHVLYLRDLQRVGQATLAQLA